MNVVYIIAGAAIVLGILGNNSSVLGIGVLMFAAVAGWKLVVWGSKKTQGAVSNALEERRSEKDFQKNLRREVQRETELAKVRNQSTIELLSAQVNLIAAQKKEGLNVEKEIHHMREKLLAYERVENTAMIEDLKQVLDNI